MSAHQKTAGNGVLGRDNLLPSRYHLSSSQRTNRYSIDRRPPNHFERPHRDGPRYYDRTSPYNHSEYYRGDPGLTSRREPCGRGYDWPGPRQPWYYGDNYYRQCPENNRWGSRRGSSSFNERSHGDMNRPLRRAGSDMSLNQHYGRAMKETVDFGIEVESDQRWAEDDYENDSFSKSMKDITEMRRKVDSVKSSLSNTSNRDKPSQSTEPTAKASVHPPPQVNGTISNEGRQSLDETTGANSDFIRNDDVLHPRMLFTSCFDEGSEEVRYYYFDVFNILHQVIKTHHK